MGYSYRVTAAAVFRRPRKYSGRIVALISLFWTARPPLTRSWACIGGPWPCVEILRTFYEELIDETELCLLITSVAVPSSTYAKLGLILFSSVALCAFSLPRFSCLKFKSSRMTWLLNCLFRYPSMPGIDLNTIRLSTVSSGMVLVGDMWSLASSTVERNWRYKAFSLNIAFTLGRKVSSSLPSSADFFLFIYNFSFFAAAHFWLRWKR